jgi:hypothetical protein
MAVRAQEGWDSSIANMETSGKENVEESGQDMDEHESVAAPDTS